MSQLTLDLQPTPEYRTISLSQNQTAIVDAEDFEWLSQWKWNASWNPKTKSFYAKRNVPVGPKGHTRQTTVLMHREIMHAPPGIQVDHIFHDTLDNRKSRLRLATQMQNQGNVGLRRNNTTGVRGIYLRPNGKFLSCIGDGNGRRGRQIYLGTFDTAAEASAAYEVAAARIRGEFYSPVVQPSE